MTRYDTIKQIGVRPALAVVGASFALYAIAMLTISLVGQPPMDGAAPQNAATAHAERIVLHIDALTPTELDLI